MGAPGHRRTARTAPTTRRSTRAGRSSPQGDGASLYDPAFQAQVQKEILGGRTFEAGLNPFNNPPHLVLPFVPLAALPLATSYLVWAAVQLALLGWLLWRLLTRVAATGRVTSGSLLVAASIAAPPLALALLQGSFSLLVTVALLEVYLALRAGGERAAAAWLVVASVKPQAVLTTGVALVAARRWRVLGFAAVGRSRPGRGRRPRSWASGSGRPTCASSATTSARSTSSASGRRSCGTCAARWRCGAGRQIDAATASLINTIALVGAGRGARRGRLAVARPLGPGHPGVRAALRADPRARPAVQPAPQPA